MASKECQPRLGVSWEVPPAQVLDQAGPVSLERGCQCAPLRGVERTEAPRGDTHQHQGKGTETARSSWPSPAFENRVRLCNSNMLAAGAEAFQASSHGPRVPWVCFWLATKSTSRIKLSENLNFL